MEIESGRDNDLVGSPLCRGDTTKCDCLTAETIHPIKPDDDTTQVQPEDRAADYWHNTQGLYLCILSIDMACSGQDGDWFAM